MSLLEALAGGSEVPGEEQPVTVGERRPVRFDEIGDPQSGRCIRHTGGVPGREGSGSGVGEHAHTEQLGGQAEDQECRQRRPPQQPTAALPPAR